MRQLIEEVLDIEGKKYEEVPDSLAKELSGSIAIAFGIKKRDNKYWIPKGKLKSLEKLTSEIEADLAESKELLEVENLRKKAWVVFKVKAKGLGEDETTVGSESEKDKAINNVLNKLITNAGGKFSIEGILVSETNRRTILDYYKRHPQLITAEKVDYKLEQ